ncbi:MAG: glutamine amidotransferase [Gammaproteobacteria bacterium]|nr:MAG: glutamine amidotransferase [Gammaproteobacteria bacterium]
MKLLIVEGNPESIWQARQAAGAVPYHRRFIQLLAHLGYDDVAVAFPADNKALPTSTALRDFDGILLTGSALNIYSPEAEVVNQLDFAEQCFASGVPIYGSCWGLQVAVVAAGGRVGKSVNGREFGLARAITLTDSGKNSRFYRGKPAVFDALCIHEDDTHELPANAEVLATNAHSQVQALTLHYKQSAFFGVQYHPEFTFEDVKFIADFMHQRLCDDQVFTEAFTQADCLAEIRSHPNATDVDFHTLEIQRWLQAL